MKEIYIPIWEYVKRKNQLPKKICMTALECCKAQLFQEIAGDFTCWSESLKDVPTWCSNMWPREIRPAPKPRTEPPSSNGALIMATSPLYDFCSHMANRCNRWATIWDSMPPLFTATGGSASFYWRTAPTRTC